MQKNKDCNNINSINIDNSDNSRIDIYVISCFHNIIWNSNLFDLTSPDKSVISIINNKMEKNYAKNENYCIILHQINIKNNYNDIETISLFLSHKNKKLSLNLGQFIIKSEENKFFFNDLNFDSNKIKEIKELNEAHLNMNIGYFLNLNYSIKLTIFNDFIEKKKIIKKYSSFLVNNFFSSAKKELILYSDIIKLFTLSHGNKIITTFFDNCYNFKFKRNIFEDDTFNNLLNLYFDNNDSFNAQNEIFFYEEKKSKKVKNTNLFKKYKKDIDNFMYLYVLFSREIFDKKKILELDVILKKILNNFDNILDYLNFLSDNFRAYILISKEKKEKDRIIKIEKSRIRILNINIIDYITTYSNLIILQEEENFFFIDTSEILENIIELFQIDLVQLLSLKDIYLKEEKFLHNPMLLEKINKIIHYKGIDLAKRGEINNHFLLSFLVKDELYHNNNYKEYKDLTILKGFNTSLMDEKFIQNYNGERIYQLFEEDLNGYLSTFSKKIKHTKFFGLFFKLLPPKKYNLDTINVVLKWSEENIKTYNKEECPHFLEEMNIFLKILIIFGNQYVNQFIDIIEKNLNNYYLELFVKILNTNNYLNIQNKEYIIGSIININKAQVSKNDLNLENILYFTKNIIIHNDQVKQIFLNKLDIYHLLRKDFYKMNKKYKLFVNLLNDTVFTLKNNERNKNTSYWDKTRNKCLKIYNDLENLNINLSNPMKLFKEEVRNQALKKLMDCLEENDPDIKCKTITMKIKLYMEKWKNEIEDINNIIAYEDTFFKEENRTIKNDILNLVEKITDSNIQEINKDEFQAKLSKYKNEIKISKERLKLNESLLFKKIYNKYEVLYFDKEVLLDISEKYFYKIANILECDINNIELDEDNEQNIKFLCEIYYNNQKDFIIEIDRLYNYFKKENSLFKEKFMKYIEITSRRKILKSIISGIIIFIEEFSNNNLSKNESDIYENLKKYKNDLEINKNITLENMKEIIDFLIKNMDINLNLDEKNKKLYEFLLSVSNCPESIQFIKDKKISEINNLTSFLVDINEVRLLADQLNNFISLVNFLEKLLYQNKEKSIFEIIKIIFQNILDDNKNCLLFNEYISNYKEIQYFFDIYLKPIDGCIKKVKLILEKSFFNISLIEEKKKYEIQGHYECQMNKTNDIVDESKSLDNKKENEYKKQILDNYYNNIIKKFNEFSKSIFLDSKELKILDEKLLISKIPEKEKKIIEMYMASFKQIKELIYIFNELYSRGYPEDIYIKIYFYNYDIICIEKKNFIKLNALIIYYKNIKRAIKSTWELNFLKKDSVIPLFYERQIYFLYRNLLNQKEELNIDLLKSLTNCNINNLNNFTFQGKENTNYDLIISKVEEHLNNIMNYNNKIIGDIFIENKIKEEFNNYIGIYYYISLNQDVDSLFIYQKLTGKLPINACFLYCTPDTSSEEIVSFIYRSIYCQDNILFCIIYAEYLGELQSKKLISTIKTLYKKNSIYMKACLLIIINNKISDVYNSFIKNKILQNFYFPDEEKELKILKNSKTIVISSNYCGFGKSENIKDIMNQINSTENKWNYIYFPLGGKFNKEKLIKRLNSLTYINNEEKNFYFHIDLNQLEELFLTKEFIFKVIILNKYDINENIKYFGKNIRFIIEIPNDFINYFDEIKLLSFFNQVNKRLQTSMIKQSKELDLVSSILFMYDSNDILDSNYNIKSPKINLTKEQKNEIIMKFLNQSGIQNPNLYQINIFIKILYEELIKFSNDNCYSPKILKENLAQANMTIKEALGLRKFIIHSLIEITKLVTIGPYENLIKNQEIKKNDKEEYNVKNKNGIFYKNQNEDYLSIDSKNDTFKNIKNSLIIFNDDEISCTIIPVCLQEDPEFTNLEKIRNIQNLYLEKINNNNYFKNNINDDSIIRRLFSFDLKQNKNENVIEVKHIEKINNIKSLKSNEILDILLNILNFRLNDDEKQKLLNNYIFTPDNFIKLILVILRIKAKIPIIIMGETGCGKFSLIEIASKLINQGNNTIYKMTINSGTTIEDIYDFLTNIVKLVKREDKIILENKKKESEEEEFPLKKSNSTKTDFKTSDIFNKEISKRLIWIYFDEINTCHSIGLLEEILLKKSFLGKYLDERFVFFSSM